MTTPIDEILEAGTALLTKHGIRRTSMNDIADAAGVSRQTLYSRFENKEGIVQAIILYVTAKTVFSIEEQWRSCSSASGKIDIFFEHAVVASYQIVQTMPDAADLFGADHPMVAQAIKASEKQHVQLLRSMLQPRNAALSAHGETAASIASFIVATGYGMKHNATSLTDLRKKLSTLRRMIMLMLGDDF